MRLERSHIVKRSHWNHHRCSTAKCRCIRGWSLPNLLIVLLKLFQQRLKVVEQVEDHAGDVEHLHKHQLGSAHDQLLEELEQVVYRAEVQDH